MKRLFPLKFIFLDDEEGYQSFFQDKRGKCSNAVSSIALNTQVYD